MEKNTKSQNKNTKLRKWLRIIHRDLGFLMVGICLIYGISGILLNHMKGKDPAYKTVSEEFLFEKQLSKDDFTFSWQSKKDLPELKKVLEKNENQLNLMLDGGIGEYDKNTGIVSYTSHTKRQLVYWINKLHYNKVKGWYLMADIFAVSLIIFAISGVFMVVGKKGLKGSGKWWLLIGFLIPIIYLAVS